MTRVDPELQERVDRLFDRFERMSDAEFMLLRTVWDQQDARAREEAWTMVKFAVRRHRREKMLDSARDRIASWVNNYPAMPLNTFGYLPETRSGLDAGSVRKAAIPPMLDVVAATIASDELSAAEQSLLLEPITSLAP